MRRVLVVDDNIAFAENLAEIVGDAGVGDTVVAESGERALSLVCESRFDVLVTDMRMPGMDGAELIHRVRVVDPSLPIVVVTAFSGEDRLRDVEGQGVLSVFAKPPPIVDLLRAVAGARRGIVVVISDSTSAVARDLVETLRARGLSCVTALDITEVVPLQSAAVIALLDARGADDDRLTLVPLAARFPKAMVIAAIDKQQALAALETMCGALTRES